MSEAMRWFVRGVGGIMTLLFFVVACQAASAYTIVEQSTVNVRPGEAKRVFVSIKNQNSYTWTGGITKTSLYLYGNSTPLKHSSWIKNDLPGTIDQTTVAPGAFATVSFYVQAPSVPGDYTERFLLGDGSTWHKDTVIQITFHVTNDASPTPMVLGESTEVSSLQANIEYYKAEIESLSGLEWQVAPGNQFSATVKVKNRGSRTWVREGTGGVAYLSTKTQSAFWHETWRGQRMAASMVEEQVAPGRIATFQIKMQAPGMSGKYSESFELYVDGISMINGSRVTLPITVVGSSYTTVSTPTAQNTQTTTGSSGSGEGLAAQLLLMPRGPFEVPGDTTLTFNYGIKNVGSATWNGYAVRFLEVSPNLGSRLSDVEHSSWVSDSKAIMANTITEPGHLGLISFKVKAPAKKGSYVLRFALETSGHEIDGSWIDIPITVTADGYIAPQQTSTPTSFFVPKAHTLISEPIIRVGVYATTDDTLMVRGVSTGYALKQDSKTICSFSQTQELKVVYDRANRVYKATGPGCQTQSTNYYVIEAADGISPLEVTDFYRPVSWLPGANDNKFRAKLELRYTPKTDKVWLINELPMEYYLKGIAETSDVSPIEFQKTLLVAARTYAMYHVERGTKHADEYYTVDAKYDQVYRGYGQEARSPNIVRGIDATRGIIVTYQGEIAITPYFSRSDGRTRDWSEVWYGEVEWCKGVPVPQDAGKTLWGHGVGMSASGALAMAAHENRTYDYILKYFYTGIDLIRWY